MKRKLIDFEVFRKIKDDSLSSAETELTEAEDVLARALNVDQLQLHCFGESDVTYETPDKSYIHASYQMNEKAILFENIEELVIDEQTSKKEARSLLTSMVEELLKNNETKAEGAFMQYLTMPTVRRSLMEGKFIFGGEDKKDKGKGKDMPFGGKKKKKKKGGFPFGGKKDKFEKKGEELKFQVKASKKMVKEWLALTENVSNYLDYQQFGPVMQQSEAKRDDKGNVVALKIPTTHVRNEGKILNMTFKHMLDTELKVMRGKMKTVHEDQAFCRAMADLRKCNAVSDQQGLQDVLEAVVTRWPELLYLTQTELAESISIALETLGEANYDDQMCSFMAEGILMTAVNAYSERVNKIVRLSGAELDKTAVYESFQALVHKFYPSLDEVTQLEMQVFVDLYNALVDVHEVACTDRNEGLAEAVTGYLRELHAVLKQEAEPTLELAGEVASWLSSLVESNVPGAEETWNVSNSTHQTIVGDHPRMSWAAKQDASPSKFPGDWGGKLPVSDGKSYKGGGEEEMRDRSWGQAGPRDDMWPSLKNPYVPKPFGDYKMKEPSAVNSGDSDWSRWQSKDTWPNLQNPYVPTAVLGRKAMTPQNYKMKSDNLVIDK